MAEMNGIYEVKKKSLGAIDWIIIAAVVLLLAAVVVQDVALYRIEREKKSESFEIELTFLSVEEKDKDNLCELRNGSVTLEITKDDEVFGTVDGAFKCLPTVFEGKESDHLWDMTAKVKASGRTVDGKTEIYRCGILEEGDEFIVSVGNVICTVRVDSIGNKDV